MRFSHTTVRCEKVKLINYNTIVLRYSEDTLLGVKQIIISETMVEIMKKAIQVEFVGTV